MTALFTNSVFERIREIATDPKEKKDLCILMSVVNAAAVPADLFAALPGTIRLAKRQDADIFVVRQGQLRAVVTVDPNVPDRMVVASVYLAGDDKGAHLLDFPSDATDVLHPQ